MQAEQWQRIETLFQAAMDRPAPERSQFLDEACGDDRELHREVAALVASAPTEGDGSLRDAVLAEIRVVTQRVATQVGRRIGPFRLIKLLGEGGMGAVYLAERDDAEFAQRVAIKILPYAGSSPDAIARFRDERQILAALEHPNIVRLIDGGRTDDGLPYLAMEHIDGVTITQYASQRELSVRARVGLIRRVCGALQYAHQNLVVHRDIKPSNILVDTDGAPKVLDFGIAKLLSPTAGFQREAQTRTGVAMFTPEYASPEQARGDAVATATDVYSVGAVLYELVAGQPAHGKAASALEALRAICEIDPPRPSTIAPEPRRRELAGDLDNIILKALHKDPARRYASMEQLTDDLGRFLDGQPVAARTATLGYRAAKFVGRNKVIVVATALVAVALLAATIVSLRQAQFADDQATQAQRERANAVEAAARAREETTRAVTAEKQVREQLDQINHEQAKAAAAEAVAKQRGNEAEMSREQLQVALAKEKDTRLVAEQQSLKAREAEARAEDAARKEKAAREQAQALYEKEHQRALQLEEASKKITNVLR